MYFTGVVGTWFGDGLASGASHHIQDIELMRPVCRHATRRGNMRAHTRGLGRSSLPQQPNMARHGGGVGEFFLFDLFFLPF